ncbi:MAG: hypothetical protein BWY09_03068 [Candidatus Hydrogenedentes bacterium ADurb.Bin179]|nr:MAG: hypothetical protein BWY09_03068 [Candidatus Hydrogenedentes bacterium ADurb.Bin179]
MPVRFGNPLGNGGFFANAFDGKVLDVCIGEGKDLPGDPELLRPVLLAIPGARIQADQQGEYQHEKQAMTRFHWWRLRSRYVAKPATSTTCMVSMMATHAMACC